MKQYPCCQDESCTMCHGSGVAEGPEADAVMDAIKSMPPPYDESQDECPQCGSMSYEAQPFGAAYWIKCTKCEYKWIEPQE